MGNEQPTDRMTTEDGPTLLEERSIGGILVHFIAIPTGVVGAGLVYLLATNAFTKRNARNALDWHLTVLALTVVTFGSVFTYGELTGQGATDVDALPTIVSVQSSVEAAAGLVVSVLLTVWFGVTFLTFVVGFIAMLKATFGTAWRYPLSPTLVDRYGGRLDGTDRWPLVIIGYVLAFPVVMSGVFLGPFGGPGFFFITFGLLGLILVGVPLTAVAIYRHGERDRSPTADWQPHVIAYLGVPILVAAVSRELSRSFTDSINPGGDAMYVFLAALWIAATVYVGRWRMVERQTA
ncbi:DUF4870 domain-containing protein [Halorubrum vacuolatum]|uniref:DUF4870 domain-containing protein n=1 Tax=Halorubrum vacuolatum TaxID=63740 RepID=A0A238UPQ8_HALVU|nr:DUF4870 domain-containing protein [Halorubrum vacuolatum]SNR23503.1 protein of unknown function [Halorubrum vacuolatum]